MFGNSPEGRLLVITDDEFFAEVIGSYLRRDRIVIERVSSPADAGREIAAGADGVLVDLAKRAISGDAIMTLAGRAQRSMIPMIILSAQPRRQLTEFAAIVCATDVVSKTETMMAIAARIRMVMRTPIRPHAEDRSPSLHWALA